MQGKVPEHSGYMKNSRMKENEYFKPQLKILDIPCSQYLQTSEINAPALSRPIDLFASSAHLKSGRWEKKFSLVSTVSCRNKKGPENFLCYNRRKVKTRIISPGHANDEWKDPAR